MRLRKTAINICVTENEKKKLEKFVGYCGLSLSEYLRKVELGGSGSFSAEFLRGVSALNAAERPAKNDAGNGD